MVVALEKPRQESTVYVYAGRSSRRRGTYLLRVGEYLAAAERLLQMGREVATSYQIGLLCGTCPRRVRRDFKAAGCRGLRGVGFFLDDLRGALREVLRTRRSEVWFVGAEFARLVVERRVLSDTDFLVARIFDDRQELVGRTVEGITVRHTEELDSASTTGTGGVVGVICTARSEAESACARLVAAGVTSLVDYTGSVLRVAENVSLERAEPAAQLVHTINYLYPGR